MLLGAPESTRKFDCEILYGRVVGLLLLILWASALTGQVCDQQRFYSWPGRYVVSTNSVLHRGKLLTIISNGPNDDAHFMRIVEIDLTTCAERTIEIGSRLPNRLTNGRLQAIAGRLFLIGAFDNRGTDEFVINELDEDYGITQSLELPYLGDDSRPVIALSYGVAPTMDSTLVVATKVAVGRQQLVAILELDLGSMALKKRDSLESSTQVSQIIALGDTLIIDDLNTYVRTPTDGEWRQLERAERGGFKNLRWVTSGQYVDTCLYATGAAAETSIGSRRVSRGNVVLKMNKDFAQLSADTSYLQFANQGSDEIISYNANGGLSIVPEQNVVIVTGTTGLVERDIPLWLTVPTPSHLFIHTYDLNLNVRSKRLLGGDAFYYNTHSSVHDGHLVMTGLKYVDSLDIMEAFIFVEPLGNLTSTVPAASSPAPTAAPLYRELTISPNPNQGTFTIGGLLPAARGTWELTSSLGQILRNGSIVESSDLRLENVPPGTYFVRVVTKQYGRYLGRVLVR